MISAISSAQPINQTRVQPVQRNNNSAPSFNGAGAKILTGLCLATLWGAYSQNSNNSDLLTYGVMVFLAAAGFVAAMFKGKPTPQVS